MGQYVLKTNIVQICLQNAACYDSCNFTLSFLAMLICDMGKVTGFESTTFSK